MVFEILAGAQVKKNVSQSTFCYEAGAKWKRRAVEFSAAWIAFLKEDFKDRQLLRRVLVQLDDHVIPYLPSPELLIDYLTSLFKKGGIIGWLSLSSLFTLIRKHRLDYPHFFDQLLPMLTPEMMHSRYRKRFLSLLSTFMRSTHITETQLRAFLKRVCRLSLSAPPSAAHWIIPFCYNMLKQHNLLHSMIHSEQIHDESLYELSVLFSHHIGAISRQSEMLKDRMHRPPFSLEKYIREGDFFTIPALLGDELNHKWSKAPPMVEKIPATLFSQSTV